MKKIIFKMAVKHNMHGHAIWTRNEPSQTNAIQSREEDETSPESMLV